MKSIKMLVGCAMGVLVMVAGQALATPIIDKANNTGLNAGFSGGTNEWQQTITAGKTGKLTGIQLFGAGTAEVRIGLNGGYNSGPWAADVHGAPLGSLIDLSSFNIFVTSGHTFVIDVENFSNWLSGTYGKTGLGQLYFTNQSVSGYKYDGWALGYVTYVDTDASAVPEPGSLALFALSALGLVAVRRRQRN